MAKLKESAFWQARIISFLSTITKQIFFQISTYYAREESFGLLLNVVEFKWAIIHRQYSNQAFLKEGLVSSFTKY